MSKIIEMTLNFMTLELVTPLKIDSIVCPPLYYPSPSPLPKFCLFKRDLNLKFHSRMFVFISHNIHYSSFSDKHWCGIVKYNVEIYRCLFFRSELRNPLTDLPQILIRELGRTIEMFLVMGFKILGLLFQGKYRKKTLL